MAAVYEIKGPPAKKILGPWPNWVGGCPHSLKKYQNSENKFSENGFTAHFQHVLMVFFLIQPVVSMYK